MKNFSPLNIAGPVMGFPARIGVITRVDGTVYRFAESDEPITVEGNTYAIVPGLSVSAVKHTGNGEMPSCQIVGVHQSGAAIFDSDDLDIGFYDGATVQIYIIDRMNLSRKGLLFTGAISTISYDTQNRVSIDVKGPVASAKILMTEKRSPMCRTDLFSVLCGVNKTSYAVSTTVTSIINAFNFTVTGLAQADTWFNQGVVVPTGVGKAFEIANWVQSTQTITSYLPCNRILTVGGALTLYPGCDKTDTMSGCGKYSNWLNFQGENHFLGTAAAAQQV